ncbi:unnamed protein product [Candidula unifasciata]|uniref:U1-type domain-containing protein n=1 Tax=Candidula unifasciata TaxID=100452 RepID=A0A8S3ZGA7_9EUPU|nr:unnamed protein product [Candidula unifasciata]
MLPVFISVPPMMKRKMFAEYISTELLSLLTTDPTKKYKFDLANYRTPSGRLYCSYCDTSMDDEPQFLLHLGNRKHQDALSMKKKCRKPEIFAVSSIKSVRV